MLFAGKKWEKITLQCFFYCVPAEKEIFTIGKNAWIIFWQA